MSSATASGGFRLLRAVFLSVVSIEVVVLALTGVVLSFTYQPSSDSAWQALLDGRGDLVAHLSRVVHQVCSALLTVTVLVGPLLLALRDGVRARAWTGLLVGIAVLAASLAASFTGLLLPWDQLALWAVDVGANYRGYRPLFGDDVRFVLVGGVELGSDTMARWLFVHVGLGCALFGLVALAWRRHVVLRRRARM